MNKYKMFFAGAMIIQMFAFTLFNMATTNGLLSSILVLLAVDMYYDGMEK